MTLFPQLCVFNESVVVNTVFFAGEKGKQLITANTKWAQPRTAQPEDGNTSGGGVTGICVWETQDRKGPAAQPQRSGEETRPLSAEPPGVLSNPGVRAFAGHD